MANEEIRKTILVVDDSKTALYMVTTILKREPYRVITANDGQEAVERVAAERPDLVVMDVMMPRKNGLEACRELKQGRATKALPVILLTTRGEEENVVAGRDSGCDAYLTKPIDANELLTKIRGYLAAPPSPTP